jgi:hypothetical protein
VAKEVADDFERDTALQQVHALGVTPISPTR